MKLENQKRIKDFEDAFSKIADSKTEQEIYDNITQAVQSFEEMPDALTIYGMMNFFLFGALMVKNNISLEGTLVEKTILHEESKMNKFLARDRKNF